MANETSKTPTPGQQPQTIPLSKIHDLPGVFNPKPVESKLGSMILSIQTSGVKEPVILRDRGDGEYQLLSGYRRRRASELAKKKDIPAFVYEMTMQEAIAYCKAVKSNPNAPIPGKLVDPAAKNKDTEKPTADKDGKAKDAAPAVPGDKAQNAAEGKDKPAQPSADKGKDGEKPAEKKNEAEHKPTVAELEAKAKDGKPVNLSELAKAQEREREAKKNAAEANKPKGTLHPANEATKQLAKAAVPSGVRVQRVWLRHCEPCE